MKLYTKIDIYWAGHYICSTEQARTLREARKQPWVIQDWAGNLMDYGRFASFEDAEEYLGERLGDDYDTDRQEYFIVKDTL